MKSFKTKPKGMMKGLVQSTPCVLILTILLAVGLNTSTPLSANKRTLVKTGPNGPCLLLEVARDTHIVSMSLPYELEVGFQ